MPGSKYTTLVVDEASKLVVEFAAHNVRRYIFSKYRMNQIRLLSLVINRLKVKAIHCVV
jgi:hypothetical protein